MKKKLWNDTKIIEVFELALEFDLIRKNYGTVEKTMVLY